MVWCMQLFQMKDDSNGTRLMEIYLEENYVSFGWKEFKSLSNISEAEFRSKALLLLNDIDGMKEEWIQQIEEIHTFVYRIQDGDYIIMESDGFVHIGDLGDYFYVDGISNKEVNTAHRRGVTWLKSVPIELISEELQTFVSQQSNISILDRLVSPELLESWLDDKKDNGYAKANLVDEQTIEQALTILKNAMHSDDFERRERAAIAILQYAK